MFWNRTVFDIETACNEKTILILNWIDGNRKFFDIQIVHLCEIELFETELFFFLLWNYVHLLNWIVWNRTIYMHKNGFGNNNLQWLMCHKTKPNYNYIASSIPIWYQQFSNRSIWAINGTPKCTNTLSLSWPGRNGNR